MLRYIVDDVAVSSGLFSFVTCNAFNSQGFCKIPPSRYTSESKIVCEAKSPCGYSGQCICVRQSTPEGLVYLPPLREKSVVALTTIAQSYCEAAREGRGQLKMRPLYQSQGVGESQKSTNLGYFFLILKLRGEAAGSKIYRSESMVFELYPNEVLE